MSFGLSKVMKPFKNNFIKKHLSKVMKRSFYKFSVHHDFLQRYTKNATLQNWINQRIQLFQPSRVHLCDGSDEENEQLIYKQIQQGTLIKLNDKLRPNSYLARSSIGDTARVEQSTYICSESKSDCGPTNNWSDPEQSYNEMDKLFLGSMRGRTMYVMPYAMGPENSPFSLYGVQVTDSPYVVTSMRIMTRMGEDVLNELNQDDSKFWVPCVHSVGSPLVSGDVEDGTWPCNTTKKILHFPSERRIWSYGSGYGGNAILGKKCLALRLASYIGREEGWLAEHCLIIGVTNPSGVKKYFLGAFPSACGKTNLAMLQAQLSSMNDAKGWKIETLGDDIAWCRYNENDGKLYAINPENGLFGVAPGTSYDTNPVAMETIAKNTIFTNCAVTQNNDVWWEGMTRDTPSQLIAWNRHEWGPESSFNAAHPNARFCTPITQVSSLDPDWNNPNGVPISGIIFGGRRSTTVPLCYQSFNWKHGVFVGSTMASETTAAAAGIRGVLRMDPFAMKPFCGYNMGDYFDHWLSFDKNNPNNKLPKIFNVNWFRKNKGKFIWPGFSENLRVIKWIFERCDSNIDDGNAKKTAIGYIPNYNNFDVSNLNIDESALNALFDINNKEWLKETNMYDEFYDTFEDRIPKELLHELEQLRIRLNNNSSK